AVMLEPDDEPRHAGDPLDRKIPRLAAENPTGRRLKGGPLLRPDRHRPPQITVPGFGGLERGERHVQAFGLGASGAFGAGAGWIFFSTAASALPKSFLIPAHTWARNTPSAKPSAMPTINSITVPSPCR